MRTQVEKNLVAWMTDLVAYGNAVMETMPDGSSRHIPYERHLEQETARRRVLESLEPTASDVPTLGASSACR